MKIMKKWWDSFFTRVSFARKIVVLFLLGVGIPMIVQNAMYYWQTEKNIQEEILQKINEAMDDKADKINNILLDALSLSRSYYTNEALYLYLDEDYRRDLEYLIQYQEALSALFSDSRLFAYHLEDIYIYTNNDTLFSSSLVRKKEKLDREVFEQTPEYVNVQPVYKQRGVFLRVANEEKRIQTVGDNRRLSLICELDYYRQHAKYDKMLCIDIDWNSFIEILHESNLFENMFINDTEGRVVIAAKDYSNSGSMDVFSVEEAQKNSELVLVSRKLGDFPLTLYGVYDSRMISEEFTQSRILSVVISISGLLFALACLFAIVGNMNKRLNKLVEQSKEIARGNFVQRKTAENGIDEFSVLEKNFNSMSAQLQELIEEEYKAQITRAELEKETNQARFLALQSQVNPHFMFNALETIRLKAMVKGEAETAAMIKYMAKMFRNLLEWHNNIITLREEIGFLDEFLHIQKYRFEDDFTYEIDVSEEAYGCLIPKMMLQPLVENACVHGVEAIAENRWVRIAAWVEENKLWLEVEDNGGGMTPEKLMELNNLLKGEEQSGRSIGLWNIYRRLVLYYGSTFSFDIDSLLGKGTICRISIPLRTEYSE